MTLCSKNSFKSIAAKVRGLGSSHGGTKIWVWQRLLSFFLVPFTVWFFITIARVYLAPSYKVREILTCPINTVVMIAFLTASLYHGMLGMVEVIEDYVHCRFAKVVLLCLLYVVVPVTIIAGICAILTFHLSFFANILK